MQVITSRIGIQPPPVSQVDWARTCRGIVYRITNTVEGKVYIGKSVNTFTTRYGLRWWEHTTNKGLREDVSRLGLDAFSVDVVADNIPTEDLADVEAFLIYSHNSLHPHGYNMMSRGSSRTIISPETRERQRRAQMGRRHPEETRCKMSRAQSGHSRGRGVPKSPEHRAKIKAALANNPWKWTNEQRGNITGGKHWLAKPVERRDVVTNEVLERYPSVADASRALDVNDTNIIRACKGITNTCKGFRWTYVA